MNFIISPRRIILNSTMSNNISEKYIAPVLYSIQTVELYSILGEELYNTLIEESNLPPSRQANYTLIKDYILPYLTAETISRVIIPISYKVRNEGLNKQNDSYVTYSSKEENLYVKTYWEQEANKFLFRLKKYIKDKYNICNKSKPYKTNIVL